MRIFVNNVDGYLSGAVCADLSKLGTIIGTRKGRADELIPPCVKRVVPRLEVRKLLKTVAACDVVVYDLHDADLEELELVVRILHISELSHQLTFILISSVGVWARTHRQYEPLPASADASQALTPDAVSPEAGAEDEVVVSDPPKAEFRPVPFTSADYTRRMPAPKFQEWVSVETQVLALKGLKIRPFVVCAGIPYGNGEDPFMGLFKAAWQTKASLRIIGRGDNCIPLVHVRDVARLARHLALAPSSYAQDYHIAVDRGQLTQREIVQAVAEQFGIPYEIQTVGVAEAVLAEMADILTMDLRMTPCDLMSVPYIEPTPPGDNPGEQSATASTSGARERLLSSHTQATENPVPVEGGAEPPAEEWPKPFRWWCEGGLAACIDKVGSEFSLWRNLKPVRFLIIGPPGCRGDRLGSLLAERYNLSLMPFYKRLDELKKTPDSILGKQLAEASDQITACLSNPKLAAQGPHHLSSALTLQVGALGVNPKPAHYRGWVITDFPQTVEELNEFFLEDGPEPPEPAEGEARQPRERVWKESLRPDVVIVLSCSEEKCLANMKEDFGIADNYFAKLMDRWKKENREDKKEDALHDEAAAKLRPEKEKQAAKKKDDKKGKDEPEEAGPTMLELIRKSFKMEPILANLAELSLEDIERQVVASVEGQRSICNFMLPKQDPTAGVEDEKGKAEDEQDEDEDLRRAEAEERRRKKEADEKLDAIKKDELPRLEKHSEPLRQYLTSLVVPTLTNALIEVCREVPDDPIGYISEYLAVYTRVAQQRAKSKSRKLNLIELPA